MRSLCSVMGLVLAASLLSGPLALGADLPRPEMPSPGPLPLDPDPSRPDLIVKSFTRTGPPVIRPDNTVQVPVSVVIQNVGRGPAGPFKTGIYLPSQFISALLPFIVQGQPSTTCPTTGPLPVGAELRFPGKVVLPSRTRGTTIALYAIADNCEILTTLNYRGDVSESNETNNKSPPLTIAVP